ncbi:MAG: hypothetical protein ACYTF6_05955 [Planctomycetota bacterium]|jgi:hypothetical protein
MRYGLAIVGAFVASLALAPGEEQAPTEGAETASKYVEKKAVQNDVELAARMNKANVAGQPIELRISVTNNSERTIQHGPLDAAYADFRMKIQDASGQKVPFTRFGQKRCRTQKPMDFFLFSARPIGPGACYRITFDLSLLFDLTIAGKYTVSVETEIYSERIGDYEFTIKADGLEFEVSEAPWPKVERKKPEQPAEDAETPPATKPAP